VDFHLHSHASNDTGYYAANAFSLPESYSEPRRLYAMLRQRNMDLITLTDHNTIDGIKELLDAGLPDLFISSEITTTFPEDGCNVHVTVANVTEAQFAEVMRLRGNVYELIAWLDAEVAGEAVRPDANPIVYFMTHPLMSTQNRPYGRDGSLRVEHIEKMLVLCNTFEVQNGARTRALNDLTMQMLRAVDRATIERLANKHDLEPKGVTPWLKGWVAGSDDHAAINPGTTWTEFPYIGASPTPAGLVGCIRCRESRPGGIHGGPITLAHAVLKLLHDGSERRMKSTSRQRPVGFAGATRSLLKLVFAAETGSVFERLRFRVRALWHTWIGARFATPRAGRSFEAILDEAVYTLLADGGFRQRLSALQGADDRIFLVLSTLLNRITAVYFDNLRLAAGGNVVVAIKELVALVSSNLFVSLPYLVSYLQQSSDSLIAEDVRRAFRLKAPGRLVLVTDTFFEINGVSQTIKRMIREAERRQLDFTVVTCLGEAELEQHLADTEVRGWIDVGRLKVFTAIRCLDFPEYEGLQVRFPPMLDLLRYLQDSGFTKMQISTPGTVGLTGLLAAKVLQIETASTYHTSFPEYVENYTADITLEAVAWKYMVLFYHAVDEVIVPSKYIARLLHKRGLRKRKLLILDRWVDTERFHPGMREAGYWSTPGEAVPEGRVTFVYVGRLGIEKNLDLVALAFRRVHARHPDTQLVLVGDGPYRATLERLCDGLPVRFAGFMNNVAVATALASADVKLFPSTTDTWGNAPLEAQACGLPVIVSNVGGPCELMEDGRTGFVVGGRDVDGLARAMEALLDPVLRAEMGRNARAFAERNRVAQPFTAIFDSAAYRASLHLGEHPSRAIVTLPVDVDGSDLLGPA
jgi:glycosyltransferase involved in cell wall biosynthesis